MALVAALAGQLRRGAGRAGASWGTAARALGCEWAAADGAGAGPGVASLHSLCGALSGSDGSEAPSWQATLGSRPPPQQGQPRAGEQLQQRRWNLRPRGGLAMQRRHQREQAEALAALPKRNGQIQAAEVRVVFPEGEGKPTVVMKLADARREAEQRGLDLVLISPGAAPPVARIVSWDKVVYSLQKKEKEAKRQARAAQQLSQPKEVRVGCNIAEHDLERQMAAARAFLGDGHPLRLVVTFRGGRQIALGQEVAAYLVEQLADAAVVRDPGWAKKPQRNQWVVQLAPAPKK